MAQGRWQREPGSAAHNQEILIPGYGKIVKRLASCAAVFGYRFRHGEVHLPRKKFELADGRFLRVVNHSLKRAMLTVHQRQKSRCRGSMKRPEMGVR